MLPPIHFSQTGRAHLLLISETPGKEGGALGIVTLEGRFFFISVHHFLTCDLNIDVIEEIISEEIVDETDLYESNRIKRRAKRQSTTVMMRG